MVLFGGNAGGQMIFGDTWEYDGVNWVQALPANSPPARSEVFMAYDTGRARTVLFGGSGYTWEYDGANWIQVTTASASPPSRGKLVHDEARGRSVFFGIGASSNETWEYDGVNWTQNTAATLPLRTDFALAYDAWRGRTILFSGNTAGLGFVADTWEYDGTTWTQLSTTASPAQRWWHALAFDMARGRMVLFGGMGWNGYLTDTTELLPPAVATWTRYGAGCAGSGGMPVLDALPNTRPALGTPFTLQLTSLPSQSGNVLLAFGFGLTHWNLTALPVSLDPVGLPGCRMWIGPAANGLFLLSHAGGTANFAIAIPATQALAGLVVGTQALVFDAAAPGGIGSVTNAGILRLY
jgi:hypothetical protein